MKLQLHRNIRTTVAAAALLGGALTGGVAAAGPASAASGCSTSGVVRDYIYHYVDANRNLIAIGYIYEYATSDCAELVAQGSYYGLRKWMSVTFEDASQTVLGDSGYYYYYAGPVNDPEIYNCQTVTFVMDNAAGVEVAGGSYPGINCE